MSNVIMAHVAFPLILPTLPKTFKNEKWPSHPIVAPPNNKKNKRKKNAHRNLPHTQIGKKSHPNILPHPAPNLTSPHLTSPHLILEL
jgi:hypothetical protein